jgi:hypothetical protein
MALTETKRTDRDFEELVDNFDTEHAQMKNDIGEAIISGMVILAHSYIDKAGNIPQSAKEGFKIYFPMLTPKEWYHVANEIREFYLGYDINSPFYKFNLNKHVATYEMFKDLNNKYNDFKI